MTRLLLLRCLFFFWLVQNSILASAKKNCHSCKTKDRRLKLDIRPEIPPASEAIAIDSGTFNMARNGAHSNKHRFVKTMGLRHKPTMDWGMRARARNQVHWDKYWDQFENSRAYGASIVSEDHACTPTNAKADRGSSTSNPPTHLLTDCILRANSTTDNILEDTPSLFFGPEQRRRTTIANPLEKSPVRNPDGMNKQESTVAGEATPDDDPGYHFFLQVLDHFSSTTPNTSLPNVQHNEPVSVAESQKNQGPSSTQNMATFRQFYHVSCEFYKPGGPIILWLPGESPLHSLFLSRGLAYELANATSGLLVALEHRFYGKSIPRFQDATMTNATPPAAALNSSQGTKDKRDLEAVFSEGMSHGRGAWGTMAVTRSSPRTNADTRSRAHGINGVVNDRIVSSGSDKNNKHRDPSHDGGPGSSPSSNEGLPLDLLHYLTVDQAIEDIASFIDRFPTLQPSFFDSRPDAITDSGNGTTLRDDADSTTRWILAGCSYGGNLAAWTRQRYPSKVFAAFASSAPVRSALDFFEYSTTQTDILGPRCSTNLALARDFLDAALQTTDQFMEQITAMNVTEHLDITPAGGTTDPAPKKDQVAYCSSSADKKRRYAAKLDVLSWFSPDFAQEYAVDGEEVHAAGWIWWTVASAVQYNAVITAPATVPVKTAVDVLCETMAQAQEDLDKVEKEGTRTGISEAKALASWFKGQQYFTPTKTADLQPADLDPNSVQNLASTAWLWQTCSELGYLQTALPSACCCHQEQSMIDRAMTTTESGGMPAKIGTDSPATAVSGPVSSTPNGRCSLQNGIIRIFRDSLDIQACSVDQVGELPESPPTSTMSASTTESLPTSQKSCLPCKCESQEEERQKISVFSRLLTLEAAWQECQFYFANTSSLSHLTGNQQPESNAHHMQDNKKKSPILESYPDVDRNVNNKFHGWEIAEYDYSDYDDYNKTGDMPMPATVDRALVKGQENVAPLSKLHDEDNSKSTSDEPRGNSGSPLPPPLQLSPRPESVFHTGGRYYFTNGENDPWKELTLASSNAQEFLSQRDATRQSSQSPTNDGEVRQTATVFKPVGTTLITPFSEKFEKVMTSLSEPSIPLELDRRHNRLQHQLRHHYHYHQQHENHKHHKLPRPGSRHRHPLVRYPRGSLSNPDSVTLEAAFFDPQDRPLLTGGEVEDELKDDQEYEDTNTEVVGHVSPIPLVNESVLEVQVTEPDPDLSRSPMEIPSSPESNAGERVEPLSTPPPGGVIDEDMISGDRNVMRIIPGASHCQDILYESTDLESVELQEERQHVLQTFVRWIALDIQRQQRMREQQRRDRFGADV